jgi:hypothetical protein
MIHLPFTQSLVVKRWTVKARRVVSDRKCAVIVVTVRLFGCCGATRWLPAGDLRSGR